MHPAPGRAVVIDYTNYGGKRAKRVVTPDGRMEWIERGQNQWHPDAQWLIHAWDHAKGATRGFAWKDIHSQRPATEDEVREADAKAPKAGAGGA